MALFQGAGGAVFDIASPDPALLESGALVPVAEPTAEPPAPRKRAAKKPPAPRHEEAD